MSNGSRFRLKMSVASPPYQVLCSQKEAAATINPGTVTTVYSLTTHRNSRTAGHQRDISAMRVRMQIDSGVLEMKIAQPHEQARRIESTFNSAESLGHHRRAGVTASLQ
jgi:hypothetical protein